MTTTKLPPESLLKKNCHCGESLKFFVLVGVPYIPEGIGLQAYINESEKDILRAFPGALLNDMICGLAFTSTCVSCGNITAWQLTTEETLYLLDAERDKSYGVGWIYNTKSLEDQFKEFPDKSFADKIVGISKRLDAAMSEVMKSRKSDNG